VQTKSCTVVNESKNTNPEEIYWYSDSSNDLIRSSISISTEIYTSKFVLYDDDDETIVNVQPKEEYLLWTNVDEPLTHEVEMLMKWSIHPLNHREVRWGI